MQYSRIPPALLQEPDDHAVFQAMADHVLALSGGRYPYPTQVPVDGLPQSAYTAWLLWCFAAEVAGNGLPDYFLNHCHSADEARAYLTALRAVGADELASMFEGCIPLALAAGGEICHVPDASWFGAFEAAATFLSLEEIERPSMALAAGPLSHLVAKHIRASSSEI